MNSLISNRIINRKRIQLVFSLFIFLIAQLKGWGQVSAYTFSQSAGTYSAITGGTTLGSISSDDQVFNNNTTGESGPITNNGFSIGFNFVYNGTTYDKFAVNNNGWIVLGTGSFAIQASTTPLSSTGPSGLVSAISAFGIDLSGQTGSELRYQTIGSSPNRTLVVQWKNYNHYGGFSQSLNFQIRLQETTNTVSIVYGTNSTTSTSLYEPQVGIRGSTNSDYNNRSMPSNAAWLNNTTSGTANTSKCRHRNISVPASGTTFVWTPSACSAQPSSLTSSSVTSTSATISWTAASPAPGNGYEYYVSASSTAPTATTTATGSVAAGVTSANLTGLTANTTYYFWVRSICNATDKSNWAGSSTFTTSAGVSTLPFSENFNSSNPFVFVNGTQTNKWTYGIATGNTGSSIYISNDNGTTNSYSTGTSSTVHSYRDIAIPSGTTVADFSFDWKGTGESCCDYMRVWLVPSTFTPTAGTEIISGSGRIQVGGNLNSQSTWQTYTNNTLDVSSFANSTMRLVFEWINDGSVGTNPPAAVDNINLIVPSCVLPSGLTSSAITSSSATISWTAASPAPGNGYEYYVSASSTAPTATTTATGSVAAGVTSANLTGLTANTTYYFWVRSNCNGTDKSNWAGSGSFVTPCTALSGTVTVGSSGNYSTITGSGGLFQAINSCGLSGNLTVNIISDITTETGTVSLNQWTESGVGNYTLTIQPDGTTVRTISGTAVASGSPMINFNGADRVTINGNNKYLLFRNTNSTSANTGATIRFNNGSINCTITNCDIENNCSSSNKANIIIGGSGTNSITISNNNLHGISGGTSYATIYSNNITNTLVITNNNIYDFDYEGIFIVNSADNLIITGNSFYQSAARTSSWSCSIHLSGGQGHQINNNYIGGSQPNCAGNKWENTAETEFFGINLLSLGTTNTTSVQGNVIQNIKLSNTSNSSTASTLYCINIGAGLVNVGTSSGNIIGHSSVANSVEIAGTNTLYISGLVNASGAANGSNFENNTIANVTYTGMADPIIAGFYVNGNIRKNKIYSFGGSTSNTMDFSAIYIGGSGGSEISNNMISLNGGSSSECWLQGIYDDGSFSTGTFNVFHNSINIYGTHGTLSSTYGIYRASASGITYNLKNNIIVNQRTGGLYNAGISIRSTGNFTSDYNDIYAAGTSIGPFGYYNGATKTTFSDWKSSFAGCDANSKSFIPDFTSTSDLHLTVTTVNNNYIGTPIGILSDIDGDTRSTTFPYIGADERPVPLPVELTNFTAACKNQQVKLNWITQSELNNDYFGVERSADGLLFHEIGRVAGHGNSNVANHYQYFDEQALAGTSYYRLNQVDFNGDSKIYPVKAVRCDDEQHEIIIYPNPNSGDFEISGLSEGNCIDVFDVLGKKVISTLSKSAKEKLQFAGIKPGVYFVVIKNASGITNTQKLVIEQ
jgi:hypothetical protein